MSKPILINQNYIETGKALHGSRVARIGEGVAGSGKWVKNATHPELAGVVNL